MSPAEKTQPQLRPGAAMHSAEPKRALQEYVDAMSEDTRLWLGMEVEELRVVYGIPKRTGRRGFVIETPPGEIVSILWRGDSAPSGHPEALAIATGRTVNVTPDEWQAGRVAGWQRLVRR